MGGGRDLTGYDGILQDMKGTVSSGVFTSARPIYACSNKNNIGLTICKRTVNVTECEDQM